MTSWATSCRQVKERAGDRCEYCRLHQLLQGATFHVEHILPTSAGGADDIDNLALACPGCNLRKSDRQTLPDPDSVAMVQMFNPRLDDWDDHFRWEGYRLVGITPRGRAVVEAFNLNRPNLLLIREAEEAIGLFPPP